MAENAVVNIGDNSPEAVAYKLLVHIAAVEGYYLRHGPTDEKSPDRQWLLDTYSECLSAVKGHR